MGLRVNTNIASLTAQRHMSNVTMRLQGNFSRLASGMRISTAADDAAGLAISEKMRSQIKSYGVASRNAQDGISLVQTAEGALQEVSNILSRMRELAMQASNGTLTTEDRTTIGVEFTAMISEIDRISLETKFNGLRLLDGSIPTIPIQIGINSGERILVTTENVQTSSLGLNNSTLATITDANTALAELDAAINTVNTSRGRFGASQNRMSSALRSIASARENLSAAESRIRDVDVASESADLTRNSIVQQAAVSILQQANVQPQIALSLLQG